MNRPDKPGVRRLCQVACILLAWGAGSASAAPDRPTLGQSSSLSLGAAPAAGHYDAQMCVAVNASPQQCGPVTVDIGEAGQALVRVSDIAYRLAVYGEQLGVTLFHGTMQIDGFFAKYQWASSLLRFSDAEKNTRYELKIGTRRFDTP